MPLRVVVWFDGRKFCGVRCSAVVIREDSLPAPRAVGAHQKPSHVGTYLAADPFPTSRKSPSLANMLSTPLAVSPEIPQYAAS